MTKYKPSRDIPLFIKTMKTFSPTDLQLKILEKRNKNVSIQSISNWMRRNSNIIDELQKDVVEAQKDNLEVDPTIFHNGTFEELSSVKRWLTDMNRRDIVNAKPNISALKRICKGYFSNLGGYIPNWTLRHPDRLTQEDVLELVDIFNEHEWETSSIRLPARNFLMSQNKPYNRISGSKSKGFGKHSDLFVPKDKLNQIFDYVQSKNYEAFVADLFMFKTGTRVSATLNARIQDKRTIEGHTEITVFDKGRRDKNPKGKKWRKYIPPDLEQHLKEIIGDRVTGIIFNNITETDLAELNREALKLVVPKIEETIGMPNHFWRHMFAQHMLRSTGWNYAATANLGGWTIKALEESYGKPPFAAVREWGMEFIPKI